MGDVEKWNDGVGWDGKGLLVLKDVVCVCVWGGGYLTSDRGDK